MTYISNDQRDSAEENLTQVQLRLYEGREAGRKLRAIADSANVTSEKAYTIYAIAVGDMILGLIPSQSRNEIRQEFESLLPGLNEDQLDRLSEAIEKYLQPIYAEDNVNLDTEINNLETTMSRLQTLRTMSEDMHVAKEEVVHRSSQDELLRKNTTPETHTGMPRWGSEV